MCLLSLGKQADISQALECVCMLACMPVCGACQYHACARVNQSGG